MRPLLNLAAVVAVLLSATADAAVVEYQLGTKVIDNSTGLTVVDGAYLDPTSFPLTPVDPLPFDRQSGTDFLSSILGGQSAKWQVEFDTTGLVGTVTGASIEFGIWDIDSAASGSQVLSLGMNGGFSSLLTPLLNSEVESKPYGDYVYGIYKITIPVETLASVGSAFLFDLQLKAPSLEGSTERNANNGGVLDYWNLTLYTDGTPVADAISAPEPGSFGLLALGVIGAVVSRRKQVARQTPA